MVIAFVFVFVFMFIFVFVSDQFLHGGVGEDPVERGEGECREEADVDFVTEAP